MENLLYDISNNQPYYATLQASIRSSVSGRICHHHVQILNTLIKHFPIQTYLEIGVHNGTSMSYVVNQLYRPIKCIGIDLFSETIARYSHDKLQQSRTLKNIETANISKSQVHLIKGNSRDTSTLSAVIDITHGSPVDLLFIDGDHEYAGVTADFKLYSPLVRKGGYIVFDDVNTQYPGILKCIDQHVKCCSEYEIIGLYNNTDLLIQKL